MKTQDLHSVALESWPDGIKASFEQMEKKYQAEIKILKEQILILTERLFGRKTEKTSQLYEQLLLFQEKEDEASIPEPKEETVTVPAHTRKKRGRKAIPDHLPRVDVVHDIDEADKVCECGCQKVRCGEETCEKYDVIPPTFRVIRHIRPKYACRNCEGTESEKPAVMIAPAPPTLIPKGNATAGLIAYIVIMKFADALPLYRQEKILARHGVHIPRATLCNWVIMASECCDPLIRLLKRELSSGPLINIDETTVQVHNEIGRKNTGNSYMWTFCGGPPETPVYLFHYDPTRRSQVAKNYLGDYRGYVQTDGYPGYDFLDRFKHIHHVGCLAHARRMFVDAAKAVPKKQGVISHADEAVKIFGRLYQVEKKMREDEMTVEAKTAYREEHARPILDEFKSWLDENSLITTPQSALGKAISYTLGQWPRLIRYMDQGFITPDNNRAENAIRPFVVGRKNWLFSDTPKGAHASATLYSLIETAKANSIEPYQYLKYVFGKLPYASTDDDYKALLPQFLDREDMAEFTKGVVY